MSLCLYAGSTAAEVASVEVLPDPILWTSSGRTQKYKDKSGTAQGVQKMTLKGGDPGKAKAIVKGKGTGLPDIDLSALEAPVHVRLVNSDTANSGICWGSTFQQSDIIKSKADQFKAKRKP